MSEIERERLAEEVRDARTVFVVYEDADGYWGKARLTNLDGHSATSSCLIAAIAAREYARDFLDDVDADNPQLVEDAEEIYARNSINSGGRR